MAVLRTQALFNPAVKVSTIPQAGEAVDERHVSEFLLFSET
jgi:hypothetical protein